MTHAHCPFAMGLCGSSGKQSTASKPMQRSAATERMHACTFAKALAPFVGTACTSALLRAAPRLPLMMLLHARRPKAGVVLIFHYFLMPAVVPAALAVFAVGHQSRQLIIIIVGAAEWTLGPSWCSGGPLAGWSLRSGG